MVEISRKLLLPNGLHQKPGLLFWMINEMVEAGIGVILLSSEVPEVFGMADRILVLKDGQITGEYGMDEINKINETDLQRLVM